MTVQELITKLREIEQQCKGDDPPVSFSADRSVANVNMYRVYDIDGDERIYISVLWMDDEES